MFPSGWAVRLLSRLAAGLFLAWFLAISVLATQSSSTIATFVDASRERMALRGDRSACELPTHVDVGGARLDTTEQTPSEHDCGDPMTPPGDDVPPEVEVDLENEPWDLCATLEVPPVSSTDLRFMISTDSHAAHVPASTSPPPRA